MHVDGLPTIVIADSDPFESNDWIRCSIELLRLEEHRRALHSLGKSTEQKPAGPTASRRSRPFRPPRQRHVS